MTDTLEGSAPAILARVVACFRTERISYALIGAWALAVWGTSRATNDVDFLVFVNEEDLNRVSDRMVRGGFELDETWIKWNPMLRGSQLRFQFQGTTVDLLPPRDAHDQQVFRRKRRKHIGRCHCWVVSAEDFILQKLKVGRPRDFEDALSVLERSGKSLDKRYLARWASRIGVAAELKYILSL